MIFNFPTGQQLIFIIQKETLFSFGALILYYVFGHLELRFVHQCNSLEQESKSSSTGLCVNVPHASPRVQEPVANEMSCLPSSTLF